MQSVTAVVATKKAILFDLFHTLTALETTWGGGRPLTCQLLGVDPAAWNHQLETRRDRLVGQQTDAFTMVRDMAHAIDPSIPDATIRAAIENRIARFAAALIEMPRETGRVLRALRNMGKRIGLISNADVMEVAAWKQCPFADLFDSTVFSCSVGCMKPEPEIYQLSMRQLGVAPGESIFVGDGGCDELAGARLLGISTVMMAGIIREVRPQRIAEQRCHADFVIERLAELIEDEGARR